jgi:uncharacterized 2Fe-2S/4Fe-4S cluster protein (DUF4445 family)
VETLNILVIACGAIARELVRIRDMNGWSHVQFQCLPANLHNTPADIPAAVLEKIESEKEKFDRIFVAYADCGTAGALDRALEGTGAERIPGAHCYEFYAGSNVFQDLAEEEVGSFYLTDFLVQHFERLVIKGLGLDRNPELASYYFANYKRIVYLAQTESSELQGMARKYAAGLGLEYHYIYRGDKPLSDVLKPHLENRNREARVVFSPSGKRGRFPTGTPILQAARKLGVDIDSICGGRALCGRCRVEPVEGSFAKENIVSSPANLGPVTETERLCLEGGADRVGRLACMATIEGDVRIDVPADSQVHHQVVRKDCEAHDIEIDPVVKLYYVEIQRSESSEVEGGLKHLLYALGEQWGLHGLECDLSIQGFLQETLREGEWKATIAVRHGRQIVAAWPGFRARVYGAAVDVGSTTIAIHLCDLSSGQVLASSGAMNPQIRFGEDLMSRISYAMLNPGGAEEMTQAVRKTIRTLIARTAEKGGTTAADILEVTLVGNPVMHHLLLGLDPVPLGTAPFKLATDRSVDIPASELELELHPGACAYVLPCVAGYVGADTSAVLLAETPWQGEEISLIIDVGTNAEIVLGNRDRLLAASSPTGPAFEGAQVGNGQRAAPGAIERVRIDRETLEPRYRIIGCEAWSDEPGFEEQAAATGVTGICGSGIIEAVASMYLSGIVRSDGSVNGELAGRNSRICRDGRTFSYVLHRGDPEVVIRQGDIRAIQLAKAALYAGARLLMDHMGVDSVDRIRLAGAFGSHIDVKYAMVLGMIPDCELENVSSAANAAGTGARVALLNRASRDEIERRTRQIEKIETAVDEKFQQHFVDAMGIPHSTQSYPCLSQHVDLPTSETATAGPVGRRGRRTSRT